MRREAQQVLSKALRSFPYSYTDIVDQVRESGMNSSFKDQDDIQPININIAHLQVLPLIEKSPTVTHEQFKGAMYIIIQNQLVVRTPF